MYEGVCVCVCVCNRTDLNRKPEFTNVRAAEWNAWLGRKHVRYTNTYTSCPDQRTHPSTNWSTKNLLLTSFRH